MTGQADQSSENVHATAIVAGQTGILFLGPSGSGKSAAALACLSSAAARGWHAALVADDRTVLTARSDCLIAACPESIAGLIEIRGTGLVGLPYQKRAVIHLAVAVGSPDAASRLPIENERFSCIGTDVPLMRLWHDGATDPLASIVLRHPDLFPAL